MSAGRWAEPMIDDGEKETVVLTVWRITSDADLDALLGCDVADFEDDDETGIYDDEPAIEDDYCWIRTGC